MSGIYKCLKKIGTRGKPAARSMNITVNGFKDNSKRVSHERYKEEYGVIERTVKRAVVFSFAMGSLSMLYLCANSLIQRIYGLPWKQATLITVNVHLIKFAVEKEV